MSSPAFFFGPHRIFSQQIFYTSAFCYALINIKPVLPGHVLIVSKRSVPRINDLSDEEKSDLFLTTCRVGKMLEDVHASESLTFVLQDGHLAGQTVPHAHMHLMPRKPLDFVSNDDVYNHLERDLQRQQQRPVITHVDNEDRPPRSLEDMHQEASTYRSYFASNS